MYPKHFTFHPIGAVLLYKLHAKPEVPCVWGHQNMFGPLYQGCPTVHIHFATDFKENSMASRMNSGGSNNLNSIKIDEKFKLYLL